MFYKYRNTAICSSYIIRVIGSRRMRWVGAWGRDAFSVLVGGGHLKEKEHFEDLGVDRRVILKFMSKK
jgi:hypothetical protein